MSMAGPVVRPAVIEFRHRESQNFIFCVIEGPLVNGITGLISAIGFAAGFLIAWLWARASSQAQKLTLEKQAASQQGAAEQLKIQ